MTRNYCQNRQEVLHHGRPATRMESAAGRVRGGPPAECRMAMGAASVGGSADSRGKAVSGVCARIERSEAGTHTANRDTS